MSNFIFVLVLAILPLTLTYHIDYRGAPDQKINKVLEKVAKQLSDRSLPDQTYVGFRSYPGEADFRIQLDFKQGKIYNLKSLSQVPSNTSASGKLINVRLTYSKQLRVVYEKSYAQYLGVTGAAFKTEVQVDKVEASLQVVKDSKGDLRFVKFEISDAKVSVKYQGSFPKYRAWLLEPVKATISKDAVYKAREYTKAAIESLIP